MRDSNAAISQTLTSHQVLSHDHMIWQYLEPSSCLHVAAAPLLWRWACSCKCRQIAGVTAFLLVFLCVLHVLSKSFLTFLSCLFLANGTCTTRRCRNKEADAVAGASLFERFSPNISTNPYSFDMSWHDMCGGACAHWNVGIRRHVSGC